MKAHILIAISAIALGGCFSTPVKNPTNEVKQVQQQIPSGYRSSKYVLVSSRPIHQNPFTKPEYLSLALQQDKMGKWVIVRTDSFNFSTQNTQLFSVNLVHPYLVSFWFWQTSRSNYSVDSSGFLQCKTSESKFCKSPFTTRIEGSDGISEYPIANKFDLDRIFYLLDSLDSSIAGHIRNENEKRNQWRQRYLQLKNKTIISDANK